MKIRDKSVMLLYTVLKKIYQRFPISFYKKQKLKKILLNLKWIYKCHIVHNQQNYSNIEYTHRTTDYLDAKKLDIRAVAFYVQETDIKSDRFYQQIKGFPESYFNSHYQPHVPVEEAMACSSLSSIMQRQIDLAKQYGIYGFCFYYDFLNVKKGSGKALSHFLNEGALNINFCLCLSNKKRIHYGEHVIDEGLKKNSLSSEDYLVFINTLIPVFSDRRYIYIDDKPLLIVCQSIVPPNIYAITQQWRQSVKRMGLPDLYLAITVSNDLFDPRSLGFDAAIQLPPYQNTSSLEDISDRVTGFKQAYQGKIYSYLEMAEKYSQKKPVDFVNFAGIVPSWDNASCKIENRKIFFEASPVSYADWLRKLCNRTFSQRPQERFLFINAWNAWAYSAHLEPDRRFGYGYLQLTANVLSKYYKDAEIEDFIKENNNVFIKSNNVAVVLHCYYDDIILQILHNYLVNKKQAVDLFLTVKSHISLTVLRTIKQIFPNVYFITHKNHGRDIAPFLIALKTIIALDYEFACKVHTKKSIHRADGKLLREYLFDSLLAGANKVQCVIKLFTDDPQLGILAPHKQILNLENKKFHHPNIFWLDKLFKRVGRADLIGTYTTFFPAGSMYWFRVQSLVGLDRLVLQEESFEEELGQFDGTLAHGLERMVALFAAQRGYQMKSIDN